MNSPASPVAEFKPVVNLTVDPAMAQMNSRMEQLEKRLAAVTAERDALRSESSDDTVGASDKSEIEQLKEMMTKILAKST